MGRTWDLIVAYQDAQRYRPSLRDIAKEAGVNHTMLGKWKEMKAMPRPENLQAVARVIGVPYQQLLQAALSDAAYVRSPGSYKHRYDASLKRDDPVHDGRSVGSLEIIWLGEPTQLYISREDGAEPSSEDLVAALDYIRDHQLLRDAAIELLRTATPEELLAALDSAGGDQSGDTATTKADFDLASRKGRITQPDQPDSEDV